MTPPQEEIKDLLAAGLGASNPTSNHQPSTINLPPSPQEEIKDLLAAGSGPRPAATIRENPQGGGVSLYGAVEREVRSVDEMAAVLDQVCWCVC